MTTVAILLAVLALILVAVLIIVIVFFPNVLSANIVTITKTQIGTATTSDTMITGGDNLYISASTIVNDFPLTISFNSANIPGRTIEVKNNSSSARIRLVPDTNVSITYTATTSDIVNPGQVASLVVVNSNNNFTRVS